MSTVFEQAAVVGQPEADGAGLSVLKKGGNAVDAAVTTALLSGVVMPSQCGIGGYGGAMLVYMNGEVTCIDFNTAAPLAAKPNMYSSIRSDGRFGSLVQGRVNEMGPLAISVPGVLAGLNLALERFGTLSMSDALVPAIRACKNGFRISAAYARHVEENEQRIRRFPETARLLQVGEALPRAGDRAKNGYLGKVLEQIAKNGVEAFYKGRIADRIVTYLQENGGILTKEDFEAYRPRIVASEHGTCAGYDLHAAPLCHSGLSLLQMCRIAEVADLGHWARDAGRFAHGMVEVMRASWLDRYMHLGDPDRIRVPRERLLSDIHLKSTGRDVAGYVSAGGRGRCLMRPLGTGGTNHISVVDADRNAVALTFTHGPGWGSYVTVPRMGLLMNSGMSRFDPGPGLPNSIAPGKAPLVNMCPVIILGDGQPVMTIGGSGGTRIATSLLQVLARCLLMDEDLSWAISAPRIHSEGNEWVMMEKEFGETAPAYLQEVGYTLRKGQAAAQVRAIEVTADGTLHAVMDPRLSGREKGY